MEKIAGLGLILLLAAGPVSCAEPKAFHEMSEAEIARMLRGIHAHYPRLGDRIAAVSFFFLGTPYRLGPLGEGPNGEFDRDPLISFKEADCTTFVEQVMALSLERKLSEAVKTLQKIRYKNGKTSFETRNHFPEIDWIPNNVAAGYLEDITREVGGSRMGLVSKLISKRRWYETMTLDNIQGFPDASPAEKEERLKRLQQLGKSYENEVSTVSYVPLADLPDALARIPSGTIANLVRENSSAVPVLISHQVLIVEKEGAKYVRHAASGKKVLDVPALEYFRGYENAKWKLLGINLNRLIKK